MRGAAFEPLLAHHFDYLKNIDAASGAGGLRLAVDKACADCEEGEEDVRVARVFEVDQLKTERLLALEIHEC